VNAHPERALTVRGLLIVDVVLSVLVAVTDTVPLVTAIPLHVVAVEPFVTVFVPSVNCQLLNVVPSGPEAVQVVVAPRVTLVQETCKTFPVPVACRL
jgi:competence protein ComGC